MAIPTDTKLRVAIRKSSQIFKEVKYLCPDCKHAETLLYSHQNGLIYNPDRIPNSSNPCTILIYKAFYDSEHAPITLELASNGFTSTLDLAELLLQEFYIKCDCVPRCPTAIPFETDEKTAIRIIKELEREHKAYRIEKLDSQSFQTY